MTIDACTVKFELGSVLISGKAVEDIVEELSEIKWDQRTLEWRAPARLYRDIITYCQGLQINLEDKARNYNKLDIKLKEIISPREHQDKALKAWTENGGKGVVCLPTGAGKTILAVLSIAQVNRPTLVVAPTIDLMEQWRSVLTRFFNIPIGGLGGGIKDIQPITVSTYDSALLFMESIGDKFGFIVFDECHHLPAPQYQMIAEACIAPFRLGLSATVERSDGKEEVAYRLIGPLVYEAHIQEMIHDVLSPYDVISLQIPLTIQEKEEYTEQRRIYTDFIKRNRISFQTPAGWQQFIIKSSVLPGGKEAMKAYRQQKKLAQASEGKITELWKILNRHKNDQTIVFTDDNALAYRIGRTFFLAVITHQTKLSERKSFLDAFRNGNIKTLVTSKVLNEGVDVPAASVAVVVSGSGGVREHVQRLGRILRHKPGKRAVLYELVSKGTNELYVNKRRKQHNAYQRPR